MIEVFGLDTHALILDMTNFATFIDSGNQRAPIAQRGKAKQKRYDLRIVGLGLVATRDGGIPLLSRAYPGNKVDVTQFQPDDRGAVAGATPPRWAGRAAATRHLRRRPELPAQLHPARPSWACTSSGRSPRVTIPACSPAPPPTARWCPPTPRRT